MKHALSKISTTAAFGLAGAAAFAVPAQAQEQWTPPALALVSATCNAYFEWELEWSLTDTTDTVNAPDDYTYTVTEILTQVGADDFGPWEDAELAGSLQVGAVLSRTGDGSLTAVQTVPGDTERVKLKAQSDRAVPTDGRGHEGRGLKNALQHAVDLGDCTAPVPPEPEELPQVDYGVGIVIDDDVDPEPEDEDIPAEWIVDIGVPPGVEDPSTQVQIAAVTDTGDHGGTGTSGNLEVQATEVGVGDSTFRLPVTGDVVEPEDVFLELTVNDVPAHALFLETALPAVDASPSADPTPSADPAANKPISDADTDPDSAAPTLPSTGLSLASLTAVAVAFLGTGVLALNRSRERAGRA